jgi:hypothetical protein
LHFVYCCIWLSIELCLWLSPIGHRLHTPHKQDQHRNGCLGLELLKNNLYSLAFPFCGPTVFKFDLKYLCFPCLLCCPVVIFWFLVFYKKITQPLASGPKTKAPLVVIRPWPSQSCVVLNSSKTRIKFVKINGWMGLGLGKKGESRKFKSSAVLTKGQKWLMQSNWCSVFI